jgi:hypothetical protein
VASRSRGLGLGQYEANFRDNKIDADVLPQLTSDDLKDIGVTAVGDRRRLLAAIAGLTAETRVQLAPATEIRAYAAVGPAPETSAERRQLTVMFCDLVGSTAMSARLDPEDMRGIIGAYHKCCANLITQGGGFVAKYMGDGVLAYFGYPQAHEHDAERAVRAGLAIVEAAPKLETATSEPLHVRVGIAPPGSWSSAIFWVRERRRRAGSSATPLILPRDCKGSPSPTASSSPKSPENCWAICSS